MSISCTCRNQSTPVHAGTSQFTADPGPDDPRHLRASVHLGHQSTRPHAGIHTAHCTCKHYTCRHCRPHCTCQLQITPLTSRLPINSLHLQAANKPEADSSDSLSGSQEASRASAGTSPSLSLGHRMKKCQASWRPLPLSARPLTLPASPGAAYPLPPPAKQAAAFPPPQQAAVCCPPQQARSAITTDWHCPVRQSQQTLAASCQAACGNF